MYRIVSHKQVKKFYDGLDRIRRARIDRCFELFEDYGLELPIKYLKKIDTDLWELRPGDVRLILAIRNGIGYIVHGIMKKSRKLPKNDLGVAKRRIKNI